MARCGEDRGMDVGVDIATPWLGTPWVPGSRDYLSLIMTSIIRWAKSSGSNSRPTQREGWVRVENLATWRTIYHPHWYSPMGLTKTSGLNLPGDSGTAQNREDSSAQVRREGGSSLSQDVTRGIHSTGCCRGISSTKVCLNTPAFRKSFSPEKLWYIYKITRYTCILVVIIYLASYNNSYY